MAEFHYTYSMQVRYADLDAQWHMNNARFLTFLEEARLAYLKQLGLWDGKSFLDLGMIVADIHIAYKAPVEWGEEIQVALCVDHIGNKSMHMLNEMRNSQDGSLKAQAEVVMVAYDFRKKVAMRVPESWRKKISEFERL